MQVTIRVVYEHITQDKQTLSMRIYVKLHKPQTVM